MRLDKFFASQSLASRKEVKELVKKGLVKINGIPARSSDMTITPEEDVILLNGKAISYKEHIYIMMNKPQGVVSATEDNLHATVLDLVPPELFRKGLFPAGRLDKDTTGMVLITNDGTLSHRILSPKKHIPKYYIVKLAESFQEDYVRQFAEGVIIDGGEKCLPAKVKRFPDCEKTAFIELHEGKYHQIKRMFSAVENSVEKLCRIQMGGLLMPEKLAIGEYMEIMHKDVENLLKSPCFEEVFRNITENFSSYWINMQ